MSTRALALMLGGALAVVVLAALLRHADLAALAAAAAVLPPWLWVATALGLLASYALRAARLQTEWGPRVGAGFRDCLHLLLLHNAAVNLLPLRAGEAGYPWLLRRRFGVAVVDASASLVRLRVQDLVLLAALAVALLIPHGVAPALAALALAIAAWLAFAPALATLAAPRLHDGRTARALRVGLAALVERPRLSSAWGWSWFCAASNWLVKVAALGALLAGLAGLSLLSGLRGALGGELAAVLPLQGPAGLGTYEGGVWAAVALHDRSALAQLGIAALAVHLFGLLLGLFAAAAVHAASPHRAMLRAEGRSS